MAHLFIVIVTKFVNKTIRNLLVPLLAIMVCMATHTVFLYPSQSKLCRDQPVKACSGAKV